MTSIPKGTGINSVLSERGDDLDFQSIGIKTDHEFLHTPSLSIQVCDKDAPVQQTLTPCSGQQSTAVPSIPSFKTYRVVSLTRRVVPKVEVLDTFMPLPNRWQKVEAVGKSMNLWSIWNVVFCS